MNTNSAGAPLNLVLASPRGFCAGVDRAITIVEKALEMYGAPIYVQHEIVHNKHVVQRLRNEGAVFVENIDEIPEGSHAIFLLMEFLRKFEKEQRNVNYRYWMRPVLWLQKFIEKLSAMPKKSTPLSL